METYFIRLAEKIRINLSNKNVDAFMKYKNMLLEWNERINLTAIIDEYEIVLKHFIDSLTIEKYIPNKAKIIDVGTGAGFPGLPLKIIRDDIEITLLDSLNKRLNFLQSVKDELQLQGVITVHGRAEDVACDTKYREKYDIVTARAVANLSVLAEYCLPFVKVNGYFVCMKGNNIEELEESKKAIKVLGGEIEKIENFKLPESDVERNIILIKKIKETPKQYPRKAGTPSKNPIK